MKQLILLVLLLVTVGFVSCKKEYTCSCKSSTTVEVKSETLQEKDRESADKSCEAIQQDFYTRNPSANIDCMLK